MHSNFSYVSKTNGMTPKTTPQKQGNTLHSSNNYDKHESYPWVEEPTCEHFSVKFAKKKTRPIWALTSVPGSGVTWTRQLIEGVTGTKWDLQLSCHLFSPNTGPVQWRSQSAGRARFDLRHLTANAVHLEGSIGTTCDDVMHGHYGNKAELDCECMILIKDHAFDGIPKPGVFQDRGILLLRNPLDVLFTIRHYEVTRNQTGIATADFFRGPEWDHYVNSFAKSWADHAQKSIRYIKNGTVIFYEKLLLEDTAAELTRLLLVLNFNDPLFPPINPERMRCTLLHKNRADRKRQKKTM